MTDIELADTIISRLNDLLVDVPVRLDVETIVKYSFSCNDQLLSHPSLQVERTASDASPTLSFLGLLNGIFSEPAARISAEFDGNGRLVRFSRTS